MTSKWLLIEHGFVIDGTVREPQPDTNVLVRDDRIHAVGGDAAREAVPRGEELDVIDATGKTVLPGLIDVHCHISFGESRTQEEQDLYTSVETRTLRAAANVKRMLRAGVTSISNPGGSFYIGVAVRDAIAEGLIEGPRMTTAGQFIATSNGLGDFYPESVGNPGSAIAVVANTQDQMIDIVRRQVKNGVDFVKISDSISGEFQAFRYEELRTISDMAHQLNRKVTIHARGAAEVGAAVRAEVDWIMHGNFLDDPTIEALAESRIALVPTLLLQFNVASWGRLVGVPQPRIDRAKRLLDASAKSLHRAHEAGVRFLMGTDSGFATTPYGEWHPRELEALVTYCGLSPMEAIRASTQDAAFVLNRPGQLGELTPRALADLLIVDGDPLADIRILQDHERISHVVQGGHRLTFADDEPRRPYERARIQASGDITRALVLGEGE